MAEGKVVILSGPSGVGKNTVVERLLAVSGGLVERSVTATTRPPRPGEKNGVDYYFLSPEEFSRARAEGAFLECFQVFGTGHWYGTLAADVGERLKKGIWVLLAIDVQGAMSLLEKFPEAVTIFLLPPSEQELERRLRQRGTETEAVIQHRLARAKQELALASQYHYQVVNDDPDRAAQEILQILKNHFPTPAIIPSQNPSEPVGGYNKK
ncbi:MAG: guanylate kinase [Thermoguttaceae bacterium]|nr:guanylate kinase [Thermoguttaceae bacterium]MDW8037528.1 guanylate kinase [Thermoguttaceae bacterium]